jgi:hypothetical protein
VLAPALFGAASLACDDAAPKRPPASASSSATAATAAPEPSSSAPKNPKSERADRTHRAGRCGECHEKMYDEWEDSAHAKADDSPVFVAMRKEAGGAGCDRCHAPLTLLNEPAAFANREAVTCEVCHRIENVEISPPVPRMSLLRAHEVKFGPRCDPSEPYFHRARCSPLFEKPELCGACHLFHQPAAGGGALLPIHTEYEDYQKSSFAKRGKSCQGCHMPGTRAEVATAEPERDDVPDHGFLGAAGNLRGTALDARAAVSRKPDGVEVALELKNSRAGHAVPAGSPGRQLVVVAVARDEAEKEVARGEVTFERSLVDADGRMAPFYAAARVGSDTRIPSGETRRERVMLRGEAITEVAITVAFRALAPALSERLRLPPSELAVISATSVTLGRGQQRRTVALKP